MNQRLHVNLLGAPEIRRGEQPLTFATRKALALLIYLLCERGLQRREKLAALFWPDANHERGRVSLRRALAYVREALGDDHALLVDADTLAFNFETAPKLDLGAFQSALAQMPIGALSSEERAAALARFQPVADLVRGEFLAGFSLEDAPEFEVWLQTERERWRRQAQRLLERLSQWQLESGDWRGALARAHQWQQLDPLDEGAYRRQMQAHLAAGDRRAAQAVYAACHSLLQQELNVPPSPETIAIAVQIEQTLPQSHQPALGPTLAADTRAALEMPLVGRSGQLSALVTGFEQSRRGRTAIYVVEGEAGMGKTHLSEAFLTWAAQQGADLLQGRAFETGGRVPYQPVAEALQSRLARENAPDDLLSDLWLSELSRLLPDLRDRYPDLPTASGSEAVAQTRLFEAVARLGEAWAARAPVVWLLDDLQWADRASLDLLRFVGRRWAQVSAPILLLWTVRSETLAADPALRDWLAGCGRDALLQQVKVNALSADQTHEFVCTLAGRSTTPADKPNGASIGDSTHALGGFSHWLHQETGGQPFFLAEMLKALAEQQLIQVEQTSAGSMVVDFGAAVANLGRLAGFMPASVREVIRARLARLSPTAVTFLSAGAVLGQRLGYERVSQVAGLSEIESLQALDELLTAQLLREGKAASAFAEQPYLFTHDKIRTVVYKEAGGARRRVFHRRAFECLQQANAAVAELSHHALLAGLLLPAFRYNILAGDEALRLFALGEAISHYNQAQTLLQEPALANLVSQEQPLYLQLHLQLGRAYDLKNEWEQARTVYRQLLTAAQQHRWPTVECTALNRLATLLTWNANAQEQAFALLAQARQLAEQHGDRAGLAETIWNLAQLHMYLDRPEALTYSEEAVKLARQLDSPPLLARALNALAHAYQNRGYWGESLVAADEARQLYTQLGDKAMEAEQYALLTLQYNNMGQLAQSIAAGRKALALTEAIDNQWGHAFAAFALAFTLHEAGQLDEALQLAQRSLALSAPLSIPPLQIVCLTALGVMQSAMSRFAEAAATLNSAQQMNSENGAMTSNREMIASYQCLNALLGQEWAAAHHYARQAIAARGPERSLSAALPRWSEIAVLLHVGEVDLARQELSRMARWAESSPRLHLSYLHAQTILARWEGKANEAEAARHSALRLAEQIGLPQEQARLRNEN